MLIVDTLPSDPEIVSSNTGRGREESRDFRAFLFNIQQNCELQSAKNFIVLKCCTYIRELIVNLSIL